MLSIPNLKPMRAAAGITRPLFARLTGIDLERLKSLERCKAEPWFHEAVVITDIVGGGVNALVSAKLTLDELGPHDPNDLRLVQSGHPFPLRIALRVAKACGLRDAIELRVSPLQRQLWATIENNERNGEARGWCPFCQADRFAGEAHAAHCVPNVLWGSADAGGEPARRVMPGTSAITKGIPAHGIKPLREMAGLTQASVAASLGVSANHYARIERAESPLTAENAEKLAAVFDCHPETLYAAG